MNNIESDPHDNDLYRLKKDLINKFSIASLELIIMIKLDKNVGNKIY